MEIIGYGEDALTLWAMLNKIDFILKALRDTTDPSECKIFFRPSFGRKGGPDSAEFGEFDFILVNPNRVYLGESKWENSSEYKQGQLTLRHEQLLRHELFKAYLEQWVAGDCKTWADLARRMPEGGIQKPLPPTNSLLASNLVEVLTSIRQFCGGIPEVKNVLLYFHKGASAENMPTDTIEDFTIIPIDYREAGIGNYVRLEVIPCSPNS
jgi:hypothetical protein